MPNITSTMSTTTLIRKIASTRYIFLLSALVFILWSLATSLIPKSSTLTALLQMDLDRSTSDSESGTFASMPNSLSIRPNHGIGIPQAQVYVISLADRQDRREQMEFLRTIQDMTWTVVDAVPGHAATVYRILDWVVLRRAEGKSSKMGTPVTTGFRWPEEINALSDSLTPLMLSGSETWAEIVPFAGDSNKLGTSGKQGKSGLWTSDANLPCAIEDSTIPTFANNTPEWMLLSPAKIACWLSHVSTIRRFVENHDTREHRHADDVAVILEDDINMEKDVASRLSQVWTYLPAGWDIVFLGHCWSDESYYPPLTAFPDTNIHPSYYPKCTHAYALSLSGARRLLQHLRYPPFAYSRALDQAYAWLIRSGRLRGYSIVPSIVVQRKSASSDIRPVSSGSEWKEGLQNGVFDV